MLRAQYRRTVVFAALFVLAIGAGSAFHIPALAAAEYARVASPFASCTSPMACLLETNNGTGPAIKGVAVKSNGVVGQTQFHSTSQSNGVAGVIGQDTSASGSFDSGVTGTSTNGSGVVGKSTNGNGVQAFSAGTAALFAENTGTQDGIQAIALDNDGTNSSTQNPSLTFGRGRSGVWGHDDSSDGGTLNYGVAGSSTNGIGVQGSSTNYVGVNAVGGGNPGNGFESPALSVVGASSNSVYMIAVCSTPADNPCTGSNSNMYVDFVGNVNTVSGFTANGSVDIGGQYYINGTCEVGCSRTRNGDRRTAVRRYVPTASMPSVEDYGVAQLVNGEARVAIGTDFANVIDRNAAYLVFVTPEGDTNGLYIAHKDSAGFEVRENRGGRSSVAFEYRIVAHPFNTPGTRLPMIEAGRFMNTPRVRH